jgi:hypothetical protein
MEIEDSLLCSQDSVTTSYSEPAKSSPQSLILSSAVTYFTLTLCFIVNVDSVFAVLSHEDVGTDADVSEAASISKESEILPTSTKCKETEA